MFLALEDGEAAATVADRAGDIDRVSHTGAAALHHRALRHETEGSDTDGQCAIGGAGVAAQKRDAELLLVARQAIGESRQPVGRDRVRQGQVQKIMRWLRALGRQVGQVHPQRLLRDGAGRIEAEEIHAFGDGVGGDHQVVAGPRRQQRGVVLQAERALARQWGEVFGDDTEFIHATVL